MKNSRSILAGVLLSLSMGCLSYNQTAADLVNDARDAIEAENEVGGTIEVDQ